jgi:hypothetical protein
VIQSFVHPPLERDATAKAFLEFEEKMQLFRGVAHPKS